MYNFIEKPYLPQGEVALAVSGFKAGKSVVIAPPEIKALPRAINRHCDLGLCPVGGKRVVCPPETHSYYCEMLEPYGFSVICGGQALTSSYPGDTAYNVVAVGKYAFINPKACAARLKKILEESFEIVYVKQGYVKCSVCPVEENAFITADAGIAKAAEKCGADVLLISSGGVKLPPYKDGFFGGATGKIDKNILAVNGSLDKMQSKADIRKFLEKYKINVMEINSQHPFDTGSLIPLLVNANNI